MFGQNFRRVASGLASKVVIGFVRLLLVVRKISLGGGLVFEGFLVLTGCNLVVSADNSGLSVAWRGVWME